MNELTAVSYEYDQNNRPGILGTQLHQVLGIMTDYRHWFQRICLRLELKEGRDYTTLVKKVRRGDGVEMGDTLKCPDTIAYDAAKKQRHRTAFRRFFDFLNAFFVSTLRRKKSESNHYCPGKSEGRHRQNHYMRQFGRRVSPGREKGAAG